MTEHQKTRTEKAVATMHDELLREIARLMQDDPPADSAEGRHLDWLADVVSRYESVAYPIEPPDDDWSMCPQCGGEADNGHDRCHPPTAYLCTQCTAAQPAGVCMDEACADGACRSSMCAMTAAELDADRARYVDRPAPVSQAEIDQLRAQNEYLVALFDAVANLVRVKGRHHTEHAYRQLVAAFDAAREDRPPLPAAGKD